MQNIVNYPLHPNPPLHLGKEGGLKRYFLTKQRYQRVKDFPSFTGEGGVRGEWGKNGIKRLALHNFQLAFHVYGKLKF